MALTAKTSSANVNKEGLTQNARGQGNIEPQKQLGNDVVRIAVAQYDFARDGSPTPHATAGMGLGVFVPSGAIVTKAWTYVETAVTGPTNVYLSLENDADLLVSGTIAANEFDTSGDLVVGTVADLTGQTAVETTAVASASKVLTTARREIVFGCTVANVTAGKFTTYVEYVMGV